MLRAVYGVPTQSPTREATLSFDFDQERRLGELNDAQLGDRRFRSYLLRTTREALERTDAAQTGYWFQLGQALAEVDRRLAQRALIIADLEEPREAA
jgi:hypothetical protein